MSAFEGKWKLVKSQNFDELMKELGIGFITRKIGNTTKPVITFEKFGENGLSMRTESTFKTSEISFNFGEEVEETTADGRTVMSTFTKNSDVQMTQLQKHPDADTLIVRQIEGDVMTVTASVRDVVSTREYQKISS
ncbi:Fatty acid-binding protein type V [Paragonimus heterotremus]|uniref:Fatty acid-binding protein type V n=1 Tax=Paragonimus heterotremus TaxID=100268 RepID=A0A8J4T0E6_9TREM|nr:Fatty acid-binding protein type V [Paragonimus heterotremus]